MIRFLEIVSRFLHGFARIFRLEAGKDRKRAKKSAKEPPDFIYPLW